MSLDYYKKKEKIDNTMGVLRFNKFQQMDKVVIPV